jgi:Fic-DOC domain mobile mystery protein B
VPEPDDLPAEALPLDPEETEGLIPDHISTRGELNAWEQLNMAKGAEWLRRRGRAEPLLTEGVLREIHQRMFSETWAWAGRYRQTLKNIGVPPELIVEQVHALLADTRYWIEHASFSTDEIACRFHHRLVAIHPFPNGNGRHARLMTDALIRERGAEPFTWGSGSIDHRGDVRDRYLRALRSADGGDYAPLLKFVQADNRPPPQARIA